jgi:hypothetical protein
MRAVFGLAGLLLTIGVIVYILGTKGGVLDHEKTVIDAGSKATEQVNQMAGRDATDGSPAKQSATLEPQQTNGHTDSILVTAITAGGAYARFWGLQRNDSILEIGPLPVQQVVTDAGAADDYVQDAYQRREPLVVMRDGQKMTLQAQDASAPKPAKSSDPLSNQLDAIQGIPTH